MSRSPLSGIRLAIPSLVVAVVAHVAAPVASVASAQTGYVQTNLVSNIPGLALTTDPSLQNPWGIAASATSPFWISDNGTGVSTLYNSLGVKQGLVVTIGLPGGGLSSPTGQVFNGTGTFPLSNAANATFLFATEEGTIAGWNGAAGTNAITMVNQPGASYKGLAIAGTGSSARLYAANFAAGTIDVFNGAFAPVSGAGFVDPNLPAGYAPFNVQTIGSAVYVLYAPRNPVTGDEIPGIGNGIVDVYDVAGVLQRRLVSQGALNDPWGIALAPAGFGPFGGALLVGNFGDGLIHAFDPSSGSFLGVLRDPNGNPIVNDGLWALRFGNGGNGGDAGALYLTAGLNDEADGLFARITATPEPGSLGLVATGGLALAGIVRRRRRPRR